ncbi:MAG TPA: L-aspartate oxidase [Thermomicrobiales bacterium]|nr:L-aspartate oxidase [Thermomicrobiales bacterium]
MLPDPTSVRIPIAWWEHRTDADVVIIGAGIAGLAFALRLPGTLRVILVTKGALGESNTRYAQGGLAAAVGPDDDPALHLADTLEAGAGLCDEQAVRALVEGGPEAVAWLLAQGTHFDVENDTLALGHEGAHSRHRVLHAGGDATGAEIERALVARIRARARTTILEHTTAIDLARTETGEVAGALVTGPDGEEIRLLAAPVTVLANGGAGQLWAVTSNPPGATGDGIAMGLRAGATIADLEFTQFHPTVLNLPNGTPFLISEAVRGEGAYLRDASGGRFMLDIDRRAELASRDVVARAIQRQMALDDTTSVDLDLRHLDPALVRHRFPTIAQHLRRQGLDLAGDLIPVAPAAHYFMGGIVAGTNGATSLPGLLAVGEVTCTGVHGANRLASNSLLEGLVFGLTAADELAASSLPAPGAICRAPLSDEKPDDMGQLGLARQRLQDAMSADVAVVRSAESLSRALGAVSALPAPGCLRRREGLELQNMQLLATEIVLSAMAREESRGGHFRSDFPARDAGLDGQHQIVRLIDTIATRAFGDLLPEPTPVG